MCFKYQSQHLLPSDFTWRAV